MSKVYLCGGINGLSDSDCRDWREYAKSKLRIATLDPMRHDYRGKEDESVKEIIAGDTEDIRASRFVLANCAKPLWGTAMEIFMAHQMGKIVIAVVPSGQPVSPWLRVHSLAVLQTLDQGIEAINELASW